MHMIIQLCMRMLLYYQCLCFLINAELLDYSVIARIDGAVLTYVNGETNDTVWPGQ